MRRRARVSPLLLLFAFFAAFFACGSVSATAHAQVNAEALRVTLRNNPTFLWLDGSLVTRAGNSQGMTLSATAFGGVTRPPHLFFGKATSEYATDPQNAPTVAKSLLHLRYNYETSPFLFLEVLAQVQHDHFRRLAVRDLYGTGLRFNFVRTEPFEFFGGTTILLEQQEISAVAPYPGESDLWARSSNYLGVNAQLAAFLLLNTTTYVQPRLARPKDVRILHETVLTFAITKRLAAKISASVTYESKPPGGVLPTDFELKNSLAVKF